MSCLCADDSAFSTVGERSVAKRFVGESLWVKKYMGENLLGENKGRWDAGFRSPFSGVSSKDRPSQSSAGEFGSIDERLWIHSDSFLVFVHSVVQELVAPLGSEQPRAVQGEMGLSGLLAKKLLFPDGSRLSRF